MKYDILRAIYYVFLFESFHNNRNTSRYGSMTQAWHICLEDVTGNMDIMIEVDQMLVFCLMTRRRINLVRLILDFILTAANVEKRRHAT